MYIELLHKTAEMIAADDWNARNTQDMFHNQSPEVQAVLRSNKMKIATLMVESFYDWYLMGADNERFVIGEVSYAEKIGLLPITKQESQTEKTGNYNK